MGIACIAFRVSSMVSRIVPGHHHETPWNSNRWTFRANSMTHGFKLQLQELQGVGANSTLPPVPIEFSPGARACSLLWRIEPPQHIAYVFRVEAALGVDTFKHQINGHTSCYAGLRAMSLRIRATNV